MKYDEKKDREWVRRVQKGETEAFEVLVNRHERKIFNLLFRWLGNYDDAADAAQEVFVSAFKSIRKFRGDAAFSTWLYSIACNHARNRRKRMAVLEKRNIPLEMTDPEEEKEGLIATLAHSGPNPAEQAEQREVQEQVQKGLNSLNADDALLILLRDFQDLPYEEMAGILKVPTGTVKSRLHRARQALKVKLAPYFRGTKVKNEV
jgi:RNA polymerase sigma-70 factor (ECF subfamily)